MAIQSISSQFKVNESTAELNQLEFTSEMRIKAIQEIYSALELSLNFPIDEDAQGFAFDQLSMIAQYLDFDLYDLKSHSAKRKSQTVRIVQLAKYVKSLSEEQKFELHKLLKSEG